MSSHKPIEGTTSLGSIQLQPGIKAMHLGTLYLLGLVAIMQGTFDGQLRPFLFNVYLNIPSTEQGYWAGDLTFWSEIAILATVTFFGALSQTIGRRKVICLGLLIKGVTLFCFPFASSYNELLLFTIAHNIGSAAFNCVFVILLADYVLDSSRGKAAGLQGLFAGIGAMLTLFVFMQLPFLLTRLGVSNEDAGVITFSAMSAIVILAAIIGWLFLSKTKPATEKDEDQGLLNMLSLGVKAARDPVIALSYASAFVSRGNFTIMGTFLTIWLVNHGVINLQMDAAQAQSKAGILIGVVHIVGMLGAPLFGSMADRIGRLELLALALTVSACGYIGIFWVTDPFAPGIYVCGILIGLGEIACMIASNVLIAQQAPSHLRGPCIGVFSFCGAFGILIASKLGGYLFDVWGEQAPFVLFGLIAALLCCFTLTVIFRDNADKLAAGLSTNQQRLFSSAAQRS